MGGPRLLLVIDMLRGFCEPGRPLDCGDAARAIIPRLREHIEIPHPMCTSVCFGGDDLRDLYIVSGSEGLEGDKRGGVFKVRTDVAGLAVPPARVALP